jgi:hypothetical protein
MAKGTIKKRERAPSSPPQPPGAKGKVKNSERPAPKKQRASSRGSPAVSSDGESDSDSSLLRRNILAKTAARGNLLADQSSAVRRELNAGLRSNPKSQDSKVNHYHCAPAFTLLMKFKGNSGAGAKEAKASKPARSESKTIKLDEVTLLPMAWPVSGSSHPNMHETNVICG